MAEQITKTRKEWCEVKILVTGAKGFMGKNLVCYLKSAGYDTVYEYDVDTPEAELDAFCADCDFVFNLAGINRPKEESQFMEGNFGFASLLLDTLKKHGNKCPVMVSSSTQAALDNPYGRSKLAGENLLREYAKETGAKIYIYRFINPFSVIKRINTKHSNIHMRILHTRIFPINKTYLFFSIFILI